jgi:hypothetical protein
MYTAEVSRAKTRLKPSKCAGLYGILLFITKCCSDIFIPLLTYIFSISVVKWDLSILVEIYCCSSSIQ